MVARSDVSLTIPQGTRLGGGVDRQASGRLSGGLGWMCLCVSSYSVIRLESGKLGSSTARAGKFAEVTLGDRRWCLLVR